MRIFLSTILICSAVTAGSAAEVTAVNSKDGKTRLDLVGEILAGDSDKLKAEIQKANDANRLVATIRLNSEGGNLVEGVTLADIIRRGRIATSVTANSTCASACFIIFAAGTEKFASYQAKIGVHGASDANGRETSNSNSATIGMARVIKDFGVPPGIVGKMVVTPPDQMVWLTVDDLRSMETKMFGKPMQTATEPVPPAQLPRDISPNTKATSTAAELPNWGTLVNRAIALSASQNNGKSRTFRTCQPEFKLCTMAVHYKNNAHKDAFIRLTENAAGKVIAREICELNEFNDIRECLDWDKGSLRKDMKNSNGDWVAIDRTE
jgi:hypothetical protein